MKNHFEEASQRLNRLSDQMFKLIGELLSAFSFEISDFYFWGLRNNSVVICFFQNHLKVSQIVARSQVVIDRIIKESLS